MAETRRAQDADGYDSADNREENAAQRQSDAPPDAVAAHEVGTDRIPGPRATAGARTPTARRHSTKPKARQRKKLYEKGAKLVSRI